MESETQNNKNSIQNSNLMGSFSTTFKKLLGVIYYHTAASLLLCVSLILPPIPPVVCVQYYLFMSLMDHLCYCHFRFVCSEMLLSEWSVSAVVNISIVVMNSFFLLNNVLKSNYLGMNETLMKNLNEKGYK